MREVNFYQKDLQLENLHNKKHSLSQNSTRFNHRRNGATVPYQIHNRDKKKVKEIVLR